MKSRSPARMQFDQSPGSASATVGMATLVLGITATSHFFTRAAPATRWSYRSRRQSLISRMTRHGLPAAKTPGGTSRVITLPAPITLFEPTRTPASVIARRRLTCPIRSHTPIRLHHELHYLGEIVCTAHGPRVGRDRTLAVVLARKLRDPVRSNSDVAQPRGQVQRLHEVPHRIARTC